MGKSQFVEPVMSEDKRNPLKRGIMRLYDFMLAKVPSVNRYGVIEGVGWDVVLDDGSTLRRDYRFETIPTNASNITVSTTQYATLWTPSASGNLKVKHGHAVFVAFDVTVIPGQAGDELELQIYGASSVLAEARYWFEHTSYTRVLLPYFYENTSGSDQTLTLVLRGKATLNGGVGVQIDRNTSVDGYTGHLIVRHMGNDQTFLTDIRGSGG